MEWNAESVLDALHDFERKSEITPLLDEYLQRIAQNGEIVFPWCKLKPLLKKKLELVLADFNESCVVDTTTPVPNFEAFNFEDLKNTILKAVEDFTSAPFTIQRLCELVTNPHKHYNRTDKYMRGIEKNVLVVSTIEPRSFNQSDANNANTVVNGLLSDSPRGAGEELNGHDNSDHVTSSNINTVSNHVLLENFANVFPSAACIPSATNICPELDTNFISTSNVDFEQVLPDEEDETKDEDEAMDTTEDIDPHLSPLKDEEIPLEAIDHLEPLPDSPTALEDPDQLDEDQVSDENLIVIEVSETDNEVEPPVEPIASDLPKTPLKLSEEQQDSAVTQSDEVTSGDEVCYEIIDEVTDLEEDQPPNVETTTEAVELEEEVLEETESSEADDKSGVELLESIMEGLEKAEVALSKSSAQLD